MLVAGHRSLIAVAVEVEVEAPDESAVTGLRTEETDQIVGAGIEIKAVRIPTTDILPRDMTEVVVLTIEDGEVSSG
jgi:hypothetical protein